jgi:hypothetical protein
MDPVESVEWTRDEAEMAGFLLLVDGNGTTDFLLCFDYENHRRKQPNERNRSIA